MKTTTSVRTFGALAAAGAMLALTACSGGGQSTDEACGILQESVAETTSALQEATATLATDPDAALGVLQDLETDIDGAIDEISNEEVLDKAVPARDSIAEMNVQIAAVSEDPANADQQGLLDAATTMQESITDIGTVCN